MIYQILSPVLNATDVKDLSFQQDGATCHAYDSTMGLLNEKCQVFIISQNTKINWPPQSCDLTPLNIFLWGHLKRKVYDRKPATTIRQLKDFIIRHIGEIAVWQTRDVINNFDYRVEVCLPRRGDPLLILFFTHNWHGPIEKCINVNQ